MNVKKGKRTTLWEMLFVYLAVSKIVYWVNFIAVAFFQGDIRAVGEAVLTRLLNQDVLIILGILLVFCVERFTERKMLRFKKVWVRVIEYIVIYLLIMGIAFTYFWVASFILGRSINWDWGANLIYGAILLLAISVVLEIKYYFKKKEKTVYSPVLNTEEKLTMLKTLLDNNVITQDEYEDKEKTLVVLS